MKESRWKTGDRLTHRHNPDLGPGLVKSVDVRRVTVRFPETDTVLTLATDSDALRPLNFRPGSRATLLATGEDVIVSSDEEAGVVRLSDGREVLLEYPVKTCNFGPREIYYQVDTGPILIPNPARDHDLEIEPMGYMKPTLLFVIT